MPWQRTGTPPPAVTPVERDRDVETPDSGASDPLPPPLSPCDPEMVRVPLSLLELAGLFSISFSYGFVFNSLQSIVIPKEIERLVKHQQSLWLGLVMAAGAFFQLSAPMVGAWSDRTGKRLPFLVHGSVLTIVGLIIFLTMVNTQSVILLFVAHIFATVGLSTQYAIMTSLLSDCVVDEQVGVGSGVIAMLAMLGSGCGYGMFAVQVTLSTSYMGYMLAIVVCLGISMMCLPKGMDSKQLVDSAKRKQRRATGLCWEAMASLSPPSPYKNPDFMWACLGRCLFNSGLSGQVYLIYYFRDIVQIGDPVRMMSWVALMALIGGVIAAVPSGWISDRVGKKPVVYASIATTVLCLGSFMWATTLLAILIIGLMFGIGNVAYLSVDYAIGVQTLPRHEESAGTWETIPPAGTPRVVTPTAASTAAGGLSSSLSATSLNTHLPASRPNRPGASDAAKDLGLFAMAATIGQLLGQLLYGTVLSFFQTTQSPTPQYDHLGYIAMYSLGGILFVLSGLSTKFIAGVS